MKKLIALILALVCVLALAGCNDTAEIQIDKIVMTHSTDGDEYSEKVTITDKETISELLAMHNSLQKEEKNRPIADERFWVVFYMGDNVEIEWCISAYGNDLDNAEFISCSTLWSAGNHKIKSNFDYNRVVEIFNSNCYNKSEGLSTETKSAYTYEELSEMPANELLDLFIQNGLVVNDDLKASHTEEELSTLFKENFHLWHTGECAHSYTAYIDLAEQTKVVYDKIAKPKE